MARRRSTSTVAAAASPALALHDAAVRVEGLLRERARLLRDVQKKKLQLERVELQLSRDAEAASARMAPLIERHDALVSRLEALFSELLTEGGSSARARKQLAKLRRLLELQGVLEEQLDSAPAEPFTASAGGAKRRPSDNARGGDQGRGVRSGESTAPEVSGAQQVGQERRSLRELFRSLVKAIHPDRVQKEAERQRRTEVMKEVTRAYEEGDLARLLELEGTWHQERAISEQADSVTRSTALERMNRELLDQVRRLTRRIRDLKREASEASLGLAPEELIERARGELDELEDICLFIQRFRDGNLSLAELERGPGLRDFAAW